MNALRIDATARCTSVDDTLRVVDGVLGPHAPRYLTHDAELVDVLVGRTYRGRDAVARRLAAPLDFVRDAYRDEVRLTVDVGRGVAEWVLRGRSALGEIAVPMTCVFEVEGARVERIRLYRDPSTDVAPTAAKRLTRREVLVARLVAHGLTNREVADRLVVTEKTVEFHLGRIFKKLRISSRRALERRPEIYEN